MSKGVHWTLGLRCREAMFYRYVQVLVLSGHYLNYPKDKIYHPVQVIVFSIMWDVRFKTYQFAWKWRGNWHSVDAFRIACAIFG